MPLLYSRVGFIPPPTGNSVVGEFVVFSVLVFVVCSVGYVCCYLVVESVVVMELDSQTVCCNCHCLCVVDYSCHTMLSLLSVFVLVVSVVCVAGGSCLMYWTLFVFRGVFFVRIAVCLSISA